ncbi:uncharacterized protein LOC114401853 [Glycine soja]|nr:uncharacterized protein LOC114401853 [Glycine soja]
MAKRGEGNIPPRRTLGDYAYQQGPKHYNSIVIPSFNNKVMELKPALLSLIGLHPFGGMDHKDPYTHLSTFMELCSTMGASDKDAKAAYLRAFPFSLAGPSNNSYGGSSNKVPQQQQAQLDRLSKMEDTLNQFMQVSISNQKNIDASIKNLEVQVGQLEKQMYEHESGSFSATIEVNPREQCKAVTTRRGTVVGLKEKNEFSENKTNEGVEKTSDEKEVVEKKQKNELLAKEKEVEKQELPASNKGKFINIPFSEALKQMPTYAKFMKELITKKRRITDDETIELEAGCSAIIQKSISEKSRDPGSFTILVTIGKLSVGRVLIDLGARINLMLLSMIKCIREVEIRPTRMALQLADRTIKHPYGIIEDVLVKVNKFLFPADFVVMDMDEDNEFPLILGRPFMKTVKIMIDVDDEKLTVRVQSEEVQFNVFKAMKHPKDKGECFRMDVLDEIIFYSKKYTQRKDGLEKTLTEAFKEISEVEAKKNLECLQHLDAFRESPYNQSLFEEIKGEKPKKESKELKALPPHLKYVFLADNS